MSGARWRLQGPFALDPDSVVVDARAALSAAREQVADPGSVSGDQPGLYLLWAIDESQASLAGFWLTMGSRYLVAGPVGPPDTHPPFVEALLSAATEEVWWEGLSVRAAKTGLWTLIIVLELPPALADRAALHPPGTQRPRVEGAEEQRGGSWLDDAWERPDPRQPVVVEELPDEVALPARRSLITLVRGELRRQRGVHRGRWTLVAPERLPQPAPGTALELDRWIQAALADDGAPPSADAPRADPPLALPGGRLGYALPVWLTRNLSPWPRWPREVSPGTLRERDVGGAWRGQARAALTVTGGVLTIVLAVAASVWLATQPRVRAAPTVPPPAAQAVLSVCSADHQAFVSRLRCHVDWLARGGAVGEAGCDAVDPPGDLRDAWCGLADRAADGRGYKGQDYAEIAASQACFEVLGRPWPYAAAHSDGRLADPQRFLHDGNLGIRGLATLVAQLDDSCDQARDALEARLSGAVVAAHIGGDQGEPAALRDRLAGVISDGLSPELQGCFLAGLQQGISGVRDYDALCGAPEQGEAWRALSGPPEGSLIARYVRSRFGDGPIEPPLWACDAALAGGSPSSILADWDLPLPVPHATVSGEGVQSELVLDAGLRALSQGADGGPCWSLLADALSQYTPAHPLVSEPAPGAWPSPEQQLCGQICAVGYRLVPGRGSSTTPGADLGQCLDTSPPGPSPDLGQGHLDRLRLPWNGDERQGWQKPTPEQICAFNLVAQGWLDQGDPALLADGAPAPLWAGETGAGSRIAGGTQGLAAQGAMGLSRYGRSRSVSSCGFVATQCFVEELLDVTGDARVEVHQWREAWRRRVSDLASASTHDSPWCDQIRDYLSPTGDLPEGELDYPCARGVEDARAAVEARIVALARQGPAGGTR